MGSLSHWCRYTLSPVRFRVFFFPPPFSLFPFLFFFFFFCRALVRVQAFKEDLCGDFRGAVLVHLNLCSIDWKPLLGDALRSQEPKNSSTDQRFATHNWIEFTHRLTNLTPLYFFSLDLCSNVTGHVWKKKKKKKEQKSCLTM